LKAPRRSHRSTKAILRQNHGSWNLHCFFRFDLEPEGGVTPFKTEADEEGAKALVSSFDAIAALLWKFVLRARYLDLEDREVLRSRLRIPVNMRQILGIPHDAEFKKYFELKAL